MDSKIDLRRHLHGGSAKFDGGSRSAGGENHGSSITSIGVGCIQTGVISDSVRDPAPAKTLAASEAHAARVHGL